MAKKDFDIDFDFDEAYGFDAKSFSGDTAYDDSVDGADFTDEELGLSPGDNSSDKDDFDLDGDLDDFLNMGEESQQSWQEPEQDGCQDDAASQEPEEEVPGQYAGEEAYDGEPQYDEDATGGYAGEYDESYDEDVEEAPKKEKKPRKPIKLPKLPKLKTPNIFTRFFDLYFGPVLHKEQREEPVDPDNPRRRRRKSRSQIFKEVYLPPLLVCVCLIMVLTFVIGSLSNVIERHQIDKQNQQSQLDASISQAEQLAAQGEQVLTEAEALAAGYDYDGFKFVKRDGIIQSTCLHTPRSKSPMLDIIIPYRGKPENVTDKTYCYSLLLPQTEGLNELSGYYYDGENQIPLTVAIYDRDDKPVQNIVENKFYKIIVTKASQGNQ